MRRLLRRHAASLILALVLAPATGVYGAQEVPYLEGRVQSGALPPVSERLPETPAVAVLEGARSAGRYGGDLRMLMGKPKDTRMIMVYGYARLLAYNDQFELVPDLLKGVDNDGDRRFTLHLRPGHKWSDGHPFTARDFRYYWEDVANNEDLSPFGPPQEMLVDGEPPRFEVIDRYTVRYTWSKPNPQFLPALAGARPLMIYLPEHYLKQFHADYVDPEVLQQKVNQAGTRNWAGLHVRHDDWYELQNPDRPTLQPWSDTTEPPSERYVFERNPFYHRVDGKGRQLPYIDRVIVNIVSSSLIPAKTGTGESDLQARYLRFDNYTFLKESEARNDYEVRLWRKGTGSQLALYPNLNTKDPAWRELLRDVRFRRALSLGIDRQEINQIVYFGLAQPGNNSVLPQSPLFKPEYQEKWARFDPERANALLDDIGLTKRDNRGVRLLPNGQPAEIIVQSAGESTEQADVLELIHDTWLEIGIKLYTRPSQREVFRNRTFAGETIMGAWWGLDNALVSPDMSPWEFTPTTQQQLQWPDWGQYYATNGQAGEKPSLEPVQELARLDRQWRQADSRDEREAIWHRILELHTERVYTIGTVCNVPQPVVVNNDLRNVPREGIYTWEPGAYFGMYEPDTFYYAEQ